MFSQFSGRFTAWRKLCKRMYIILIKFRKEIRISKQSYMINFEIARERRRRRKRQREREREREREGEGAKRVKV